MQTITVRGRTLGVGLGWFRRQSDRRTDERSLEHLGGGGGFFNMMRLYPDHKLGVIIMGNAAGRHHPPTPPARRDAVLEWPGCLAVTLT
jgi:hypothetical protein